MVNEFIKYKFNKDYEIDIYNKIGKDTEIKHIQGELFYIQGDIETPLFNIGQGDKTIEEQIEFLENKGIVEVLNDI